MKDDYYIMFQMGNLCYAMHRNINDNFRNISFRILENGMIQVQVILAELTEAEEEYIDDMCAEFSALQSEDIVPKFIATADSASSPFEHVVYQLASDADVK